MSKKQMTPKELGERKQVAKKEVTSKVLAPKDVVSKKEMTAEEFTLKRTELAIKLINSSLETPNAKQLEKVVLQISSIGLPKIENFVSKFVANYPDPIFQNQIFDIALRKIETSSSPEESNVFKSEVLLAKAKAIITINSTEERNQIRLENATEALNLLESANALQNPEITVLIEEMVKALITMHPNPLEAFQLSKVSVEFRKTHLDTDHPSILEAYITTAHVGHKIDVRAIKIEALNKANAAYNMALQLGNKTHAAAALTFLDSIYKDFGDVKKSIILLEQSALLKGFLIRDEESKEDAIEVPIKSRNVFEVIRKHGVTDDLTLTIKQKIQESILNPVFEGSRQGAWVHKIALIEYGVSGYVDEAFLAKELGPLNTPENVNSALMLCFEAINLGVMSNPMNNPLCAVALVRQHPTLVPTMLATHPEYFINEHILKSTLLNASTYAPDLLGKHVAVNGLYNKYLETIMMPIICARINDTVLNPISILLKAGKWDPSVQEQLLRYASDDYLTNVGRIYSSTLGQNLSALEDTLNISRILMFKVILDEIKESGSKNYAPVELFAKHHIDVIKRILDDHPDYTTNPHIIDICQQAIATPRLEVIKPILEVEGALEEGEIAAPTPLKVEAVLEVALGGEEAQLMDS
jgi:hypothetical protein